METRQVGDDAMGVSVRDAERAQLRHHVFLTDLCALTVLAWQIYTQVISTCDHRNSKRQFGKFDLFATRAPCSISSGACANSCSSRFMEMDGLDDVFKYSRFKPTDEEAVTYYLPRLIAGSRHGAERLIHHAKVYSCEPKDLAAAYAPAPQAVSSGDRFFFTTCKWKNGSKTRCERGAGTGTWSGGGKTRSVYQAGVKVGEVKKLSFKKDNACTGWIMEEYRWLRPEAAVADGEMVLCMIHLSPTAPPEARQESAAYMRRQEAAAEPPAQEPDAVTVSVNASAHVQKRPAPVAAADLWSSKKMRMAAPVPAHEEEYQDCPDWSVPAAPVAAADLWSSKRMRMAAPVPAHEEEYQDCPDWSVPAPPVSSPAAGYGAAAAEDNADQLSCSWEEIFGEPAAENNMEQFVPSSAEPVSGWEAEDSEEVERLLAGGEDDEEEQQAKEFVPSSAESFSGWEPEDLEEMEMLLA